jgi:3-oxoacyl-[acyl-carrier-protein] synthase II
MTVALSASPTTPMTEPNVVVIIGVGMVSPLGLDADSTWAALRAGKEARQPVDLFETEGLRCHHAAQVALPLPSRSERRLSRASRLALPAAREAFAQAGLPSDTRTLPLCLSTTGGAMELGEAFLRGVLEKHPQRRLDLIARYQPQQQALDLQRALEINGPITILGNACASGTNALGHAYDMIRSGMADCVLAGGYEALTELIFTGFDCLQLLSPGLCRPFDTGRDGLLLGEGAAFFVLESEAHARARGADILGTIRGYGYSVDGHRLTQPEPNGRALVAAIRAALNDAGLHPEQIAYINAHGTGTQVNDAAEVAAYVETFGAALPRVAISSTKAAFGHALGAAGCLETAMALCASRDGFAPRQLHLRDPMPAMAASLARCEQPLKPGAPVMSVNLGFGGANAALIFQA